MSIGIERTGYTQAAMGAVRTAARQSTEETPATARAQTDRVEISAQGRDAEHNTQNYLNYLQKKFPQITFNTTGGTMNCSSGKTVVNLSPDCLQKMVSDPEFAKQVEWNLSGEVAANNMIFSNAKRDGVELGG